MPIFVTMVIFICGLGLLLQFLWIDRLEKKLLELQRKAGRTGEDTQLHEIKLSRHSKEITELTHHVNNLITSYDILTKRYVALKRGGEGNG